VSVIDRDGELLLLAQDRAHSTQNVSDARPSQSWWKQDRNAAEYARQALSVHRRRQPVPNIAEPFAAVIWCTADPEKVDYRLRSKWSRVLRYAAEYKGLSEPLHDFIKRKGGINRCAARFAKRLGHYKSTP
jgi:hypothetical protein